MVHKHFTLDGVSSTTNVTLGSNIYFTEPKLVSEINETNEMSGSKSFVHNITISSTNARLSPVIDLKELTLLLLQVRLNNPLVSSTSTFTGDGSTTAFTLSSTPSDVHIMAITKSGKKLTQ